jgi:hypothetical protein
MLKFSRIGVLTLLVIMTATAATADWEGENTTVDGVTTVINPETPAMGELKQDMRELWRRGGEEDEEIFFGTIAEFLNDDQGNIYLLDGQLSEIQVFDPAGELLRTIGRQGEGPGEFQNGADMFWGPQGQIGVVQAWPGKIVMITPEGDPGMTFALPYRDGGGFQSVTRGTGLGEELATYQETSRETQFGDYEFIEEEYVDFQRRWSVAPDGRVAAALSFDDYRIHVWNADGSVDRVIERPDYQTIKRNAAEKERFQTMYNAFTRWNRGSTFRVSDNHQVINDIFFREDGTLWVQSGAHRWRSPEGVFTSYDVYDTVGRFLQRVDLIADADAVEDGLFFAGNRAYVVTDLYNALMARMGGDSEESEDIDAEPVTVISFEFAPVVAAGP